MKIFTSADADGFEELYAIFRDIFPDPDEAEDLDGIRASLALVGDEALVSRYGRFNEYWISAEVEGRTAGGVNFTVFAIPTLGITTAHINYLFTHRQIRSKGVGTRLLNKVREVSRPDYLFCEQNDPAFISQEKKAEDFAATGISMEDRIRWWNRRGFGRLDMRYLQPPLSADKKVAEGMSLNVCPSSSSLPSNIAEAHLRRFFYISVLKNRTDRDSFTEALLSDLLKQDSIPVLHR